jgi:hypothetical protein
MPNHPPPAFPVAPGLPLTVREALTQEFDAMRDVVEAVHRLQPAMRERVLRWALATALTSTSTMDSEEQWPHA